MSCTEEVKMKILAEVVAWVDKNAGAGISGVEFQRRINMLLNSLNRRYKASCVRQVLADYNASIDRTNRQFMS